MLKIDRSLADQVAVPHEDSILARAIIALEQTLRIEPPRQPTLALPASDG